MTKLMSSKCKEIDIKQKPRIPVSDKDHVNNCIVGHLLRLSDQNNHCRVIFKLSSQDKMELLLFSR